MTALVSTTTLFGTLRRPPGPKPPTALRMASRLYMNAPAMIAPSMRETITGSQVPSVPPTAASGIPIRAPMSRPMSSPTTPSTNSAAPASDRRLTAQRVGYSVTYGMAR